jgi:hypothetical protein
MGRFAHECQTHNNGNQLCALMGEDRRRKRELFVALETWGKNKGSQKNQIVQLIPSGTVEIHLNSSSFFCV